MRVLHIVRQYHPAVGGLENFVRSLVKEQRDQGMNVEVLTLDRVFHRTDSRLLNSEMVDGVPVRRVGFLGSYKYPIAPAVLRNMDCFDIIHVHGVDFFVDFLALTRFFRKSHLVLSTHGGFFHTPYANRLKRLFFWTVTRLSLRAFSQVYACSQSDYMLFSRVCSKKLTLIENGVDTSKFFAAGSLTPTRRFIFIGRFSDNKRLDLLLETFSHLVRLAPGYTLEIIGIDWDGNLVRLREQIERFGLAGSASLHTGLSDDEIRKRIGQASYIVSASDYEGFGLTLVEGMSAGLLPIASPIPSFSKIIDGAQVGLIADFTQPVKAAESIHSYVKYVEPDILNHRETAMRAASLYSWPIVARRFTAAYESMLGERKRNLQGVCVDVRSGSQVIDLLDRTLEEQRMCRVAFANAHTINIARANDTVRSALVDFLVLNDGIGVELASRGKYRRGFVENLNGTDFVPRYLSQTKQNIKIYLLGARAEVVAGCFDRWKDKYPQHEWVGHHHGYLTEGDHQEICAEIRASGANVLLVAMGNPAQELWIHRHIEATGVNLAIGVGALFDFVAEVVPRAPIWVQRIRFEWMYRLAMEPTRLWRRYLLGNVVFMLASWRDRRAYELR